MGYVAFVGGRPIRCLIVGEESEVEEEIWFALQECLSSLSSPLGSVLL